MHILDITVLLIPLFSAILHGLEIGLPVLPGPAYQRSEKKTTRRPPSLGPSPDMVAYGGLENAWTWMNVWLSHWKSHVCIYIYCYIAADMNAFRLEWWNNGGVQGCILSASGTSWPTIADPWSIGDVFDDLWSKICTVSTQVNGARFILGAGHHQFMNENSGNILGDRLWLRDTGPDRTKHSQGAQQFSSSWVCPQLGYPKIPSSIVLFPVEIANLGFWGYPRIPNPWTHPLEAVLKLPPTKPAHRPSASRWRLNNGRLTHLSIVGDIWSKPLGIKLRLCPQNPQTNRSLCGLHFAGLVC